MKRKLFLSAREAAREIGMRQETILRAIATGEILAKRFRNGRTSTWRILRSDLNRWLFSGRITGSNGKQ